MLHFIFLLLSLGSIGNLTFEQKVKVPFKVIAIADGDTFTILQNRKELRVRIDAIDAPEKGMPYYKASKNFLSNLIFSKYVIVKPIKIDRYGRTVARVLLTDGRDISAEMIRAGYAWHYKRYSTDQLLASLEVQARKHNAGLWRDPHAVAPWDVRKMHRKGISTKKIFERKPH